MSNYADYEDISLSYDDSRTAIGVEIVLGYLNMMQKPMHELTVLDAGCGTGNYAKIIGPKVKKIVCCDISENMLIQARQKVERQFVDKFEFLQADMIKLPYTSSTFDVIICNQSLHHIEIADGQFTQLQTFLQNAHIMLNDDGRIMINTITHTQLEQGVWWAELIQPAINHTKKIFPDDLQLIQFFSNSGFKLIDKIVPFHTIIQTNGYADPNSIKYKAFRRGDSHFSLLSDAQLSAALTELEELQNTNRIESYMLQREQMRQAVGQFSYFIAEKGVI